MDLRRIFQAVDLNNDGEINCKELQNALSNGTHTAFNPNTVRLMINMFDRTGRKTIRFEEFGALWKYVEDWKACFMSFDRDGSGAIDSQEFCTALSTFGYRVSPQLANLLLSKYDRHRRGTLAYDDFIQCCITLNTFTQAFANYDQDRDGWITINFEAFLQIVLNTVE